MGDLFGLGVELVVVGVGSGQVLRCLLDGGCVVGEGIPLLGLCLAEVLSQLLGGETGGVFSVGKLRDFGGYVAAGGLAVDGVGGFLPGGIAVVADGELVTAGGLERGELLGGERGSPGGYGGYCGFVSGDHVQIAFY